MSGKDESVHRWNNLWRSGASASLEQGTTGSRGPRNYRSPRVKREVFRDLRCFQGLVSAHHARDDVFFD